MFDKEVSRRAEVVLAELMLDEPVVAVHGPRSVGKSTLLRRVADTHNVSIVDLDDPEERDLAEASPNHAVSGQRPLCIDEYQHAPVLLDALKARLNREGSIPGTAVLTGSTRQDALPLTAQALTGRLFNMVLWPLSQGEIDQNHENFLEWLISDPDTAVAAHPRSATTRTEYAHRVCAGGFPMALSRSSTRSRDRWFDTYVRQSVERDASELTRVRLRQLLYDIFMRLAGRTGQVLSINRIADSLGASWDTVESHVRLLEDLFLVARLPAWGKTLTARATGAPKIHVVDSGLAARMMRVSPTRLASLDPTIATEFGHLVETFVVGELRKQASWLPNQASLGHWRTTNGPEVDVVVDVDDGPVVAFEIKTSERVGGRDLSSLRLLRDQIGDRFKAGVVLAMGTRSFTYEDRLHVMPIDRLWRTISSTP